ncbi:helix-hairpin-helix domain-containing protein [Companilactobacillus kimchiensis]|uniref:Competence protein CelA n=1 Tax=Companilactobacillus kimchiensis TaxID=993692 RepID=A0A0R2LMG8_9LACO|nr:helix-hairpin-helix domain-containing protein [Companilactobacillus kimchiensis]KRO00205.1 competence protein CelA [Companilactobacillus kimchiensis]
METILNYLKKNILSSLVILIVVVATSGYFLMHKTASTQPVKNELRTEIKPAKKVATKEKPAKANVLVVDIQGAVKKSGVYRVKNGAIVQEVLQMAGGLNSNADTKQINQAQRVTDQMQVYVPYQGEKVASTSNKTGNKESKLVNINSATVDDFKDVTGIGPKKAEKIIAFREKNGNFKELHDLTKVSGIGEKSLDTLKDQLTV